MRAMITLLLLSLLSTATAQAGDIASGVPFVLGVGQPAFIGDIPVEVWFDEVVSDSRCPSSVLCVWEGEAEIQLTLNQLRDGESVVTLHTPGSPLGPSSVDVGGHRIFLLSLDPYPEVPDPVEPLNYEVELVALSIQQGVPVQPSTWSTIKASFR